MTTVRARRVVVGVAAALLVACSNGTAKPPVVTPDSTAGPSTIDTVVSTSSSSSTTSTEPPSTTGLVAENWTVVGPVTLTPGSDPGTFTLSGGDPSSISGAFLRLPTTQCDYVVSVQGRRLTAAADGWGLRVRTSPTGEGAGVHFLQYDGKVGYRDSGDSAGSGPAEVLAQLDLEWHQLSIEVKGNLFASSGEGYRIAQGTATVGCGGVFLQVWSPGPVEFRNFSLSAPPVPFVDGHPCPTLHPATSYLVGLCDEGEFVSRFQSALKDVGESVSVDGQFGLETLAALRSFQRKAGFPVTGVVDLQTGVALGFPLDAEDTPVIDS